MNQKSKLYAISVFFVLQFSLFLAGCSSYVANDFCEECLKGSETVTVEKYKKMTFFDGPGTDTLLVFIPGGLVEHESYAPLMLKVAEAGIDSVLLEVPSDLAITKTDAAKPALKKYAGEYKTVYLGGHSLGGAVASMYAPKALKKYNNIKGLLLCAAYSTNVVDPEFRIISVKGSNDQVLKGSSYDKYKNLILEAGGDFRELTIEGGNHAWFGNYGEQSGDGTATITHDEQQNQTVEFFMKNIES
ncbi:MAG: alpha/beta hydrolase [Treponema sp.]|nr:alpha/beta hydrolase [Treponema sp.]